MNVWKWSKAAERAAMLLAGGEKSDEQIADELGLTRRTLYNWQGRPEFQLRIREYTEGWRAEFEAEGITSKQNRIDIYNRLFESYAQIVTARACDSTRAHVPGYSTGFIVERLKVTKDGVVEEYEPDKSLHDMMLSTLKQAAQEIGEWNDGKRTVEHQGEVTSKTLHGVDDDAARRLVDILVRAHLSSGDSRDSLPGDASPSSGAVVPLLDAPLPADDQR